MSVRTPSQRFRLRFAAVTTLAAVAFLLSPAGCNPDELLDFMTADEEIEVAVMFWADVSTVEDEPMVGWNVLLEAVRWTNDMEEMSTWQSYLGETQEDGRTYFDARFLLSEGQVIALRAHLLNDDGVDVDENQQFITFDQAQAQAEQQGDNGLASFVMTAMLIE
jgi:hypothetical protein